MNENVISAIAEKHVVFFFWQDFILGVYKALNKVLVCIIIQRIKASATSTNAAAAHHHKNKTVSFLLLL